MMSIIEQYTLSKSTTTPSEDAVVVTPYYAAVIDGATPKTDYRYPTGETPGQMAARLLCQAIRQFPPDISALDAINLLTVALHQPDVAPADRLIASCVIYAACRHEVWLIGDCQYATLTDDGEWHLHQNPKRIDNLLADWRRAVNTSYLCRGLMSAEQILTDDPGRRIIQPQITRQVRFQNLDNDHPLAYVMLDGEPIPSHKIIIETLNPGVTQLILASDGYPELYPTLSATEQRLQALLSDDPLCIGPLLGTKGIRPGCQSYDDRSYLRLLL